MRIVLVEDECLAAEDLAQTLSLVLPQIEIVKYIQSVQEGIAFFRDAPNVDLIFSDIQLGDGLSFEIFKEISISAPIVFCTAYDDYLLEAFKTNGIDYILKPISNEAVESTMQKYFGLQRQLSQGAINHNLKDGLYNDLLGQAQSRQNALVVHHHGRIIPLVAEDIALCYIEYENVFVKTFDGKEYAVNKSLDDLEKTLGGVFFRANRQHLVNRVALRHASYTLSRKLSLDLAIAHSSRVYVSREKASTFLRWLEAKELA
ncbi:LytR/AlgR family response regulator transcription factor [Sphingobacterium tabacisoli]|uniref:LytR/AlgR family response regulator transcription factor n=1 Tax=Sphingobacterium tabacisoli TaxID=2044855 RepID=A0ABW5L2T0_9SPHI|nr:LytTR family DNA-binding domain-containing protein [Sphingobacterium tabacisoli]